MPRRKVNDIEIFYEIHGDGNPVVLIMGLRRNTEWWYCQIPTLSKHLKYSLLIIGSGSFRQTKDGLFYPTLR